MNSGTKKTFTLIELLVVMAIIGILISILIPSLSRARELGRRAVCLSNIKQCLTSFTLYATKNDKNVANALFHGEIFSAGRMPSSSVIIISTQTFLFEVMISVNLSAM